MKQIPPPPSLDHPDFRNALRSWRATVGWTQSFLGLLLGVSERQVRNWEAGARHPDGESARLYEALRAGRLPEELLESSRKILERLEAAQKFSIVPS